MKQISTIAVLLMCVTTLWPVVKVVKNADKPLKASWDFNPEKVWEINRAGDDVLARPGHILVSDKGNVYVYDSKRQMNHIFTKDGKFIKTFARRGEGPGEVKFQGASFLVNGKVIIPDGARVHYFSEAGEYITSAKKKFSIPVAQFIAEDRLIAAPIAFFQSIDNKWKISHYNLRTGENTTLAEFEPFKGGIGKSNKGQIFDTIAHGLSPMMVVGYKDDRLYWGKNDVYEITTADLNGKILNTFTLERKKRTVSAKAKRKRFVDDDKYLPIEVKKQICASLPDEIACFNRIEVHNGLIYVYVADLEHWKDGKQEPKQIDIFSAQGRYLYKSLIAFGSDENLVHSMFSNFVFKDGYLYAAVEDSGGEVKIVKYKITYPAG
jgi:hypothetical protein